MKNLNTGELLRIIAYFVHKHGVEHDGGPGKKVDIDKSDLKKDVEVSVTESEETMTVQER